MKKNIEVCLDMEVVMNELQEALSAQEIKTDTSEEGIQTEKLVHLFSIKEFDLILLFIKTLCIKYKRTLPDIFNLENCNNELKESFCVAFIIDWLAIV